MVSYYIARWGCQTSPTDQDGDGIPNESDNCPEHYNPSQADCDSNGIGDACEPGATDCNTNDIPDDCDIAAGTSMDCNVNTVPDECDIAAGTSLDLDSNGVPDECVEWDAGGGNNYWSTPPNWDNNDVPGDGDPAAVESVVIGLTLSNVILDIDVSIDSLILEPNTTLNITGGDLTIDASNGINNNGNLIVGDGHAIIAAAAMSITGTQPVELAGVTASLSSASAGDTITNWVTFEGQGVIDADLMNAGRVVANVADTTLAIDGPKAKVNNGTFEAANRGVLEIGDTSVTGSGVYRANDGTIRLTTIGGSTSVAGATLDVVGTNGLVELGQNVTIDLTGMLTVDNGGLVQGMVNSDASLTAGSALLAGDGLTEGGQVLLTGTMGVQIAALTTVDGVGPCRAGRGCTPPILSVTGSAAFESSSLDLLHAGQMELGGTSTATVSDTLTIGSGGMLRGLADSAAVLTTGNVLISNDDAEGGQMLLNYTMSAQVTGSMTMSYTDCKALGRGCTPPILGVLDSAALDIVGSLSIGDGTQFQMQSPSVTLGGNFDNQSTDPFVFDWDSGALTLNGGAEVLQLFEVAGTDVGPQSDGWIENFTIGTLEAAAGADVKFVDARDNAPAAQGDCSEALYVHTLVLRNGATIELERCRIYCVNLIDEGAVITLTGCGEVVVAQPGDPDGDGDVDLADFGAFQRCFGEVPLSFGCSLFDFDESGAVGVTDYATLEAILTGPNP
ncbi:MAG: hypothetical protein V2A79_06550 [Planctomycetota bacterium]